MSENLFNGVIQASFSQELVADSNLSNTPRQVLGACFSYVRPTIPSNPQLLAIEKQLAYEIGIKEEHTLSQDLLHILSGAKTIPNTQSFAMCYGGHQFGHWAGQLGDGRAINLTELVFDNKRWALQLKGAGRTPYSRTADGLAVLRSSVREFLCSEAMYHLGVPTTRALSLVTTGDQVWRDVMYDGNPAYEQGAVVCRVAPSFIRFGNFELLARNQDIQNLTNLCDYTIKYHYPHLINESEKYILFFKEVANRTLKMIIHWQRVGFVHGVMNTDNMSILGLTIDYGPYGWMDNYDPNWTPNTTDNHQKRYRFSNQAQIALWNLVQLANSIYSLVQKSEGFVQILDQWKLDLDLKYQNMMLQKLGLKENKANDNILISDLEENLQLLETDMTLFFRNLSSFDANSNATAGVEIVKKALYQLSDWNSSIENQWKQWFSQYLIRIKQENQTNTQRKEAMNATNPKYIVRNYMAQVAIDLVEKGDSSLLLEFQKLFKKPYDEQIEHEKWFAIRPDWARNKVGCSALSCSS